MFGSGTQLSNVQHIDKKIIKRNERVLRHSMLRYKVNRG